MTFGTYEQDNNLANGKEQISWRVLEVSGGKALLISDKNLDAKPYNMTYTSVTWATCTLRTWLNADFISVAFSTSEVLSISLTTVTNPDNSYNGSPGCADTSDKVFLLSIDEAINYFSPNSSRIGLNTAYAVAQGAYDKSGAGLWWLRSPGYGPYNNESCVYTNGTLYVGYYEGIFYSAAFDVDVVNAVRPAMWVNLGS